MLLSSSVVWKKGSLHKGNEKSQSGKTCTLNQSLWLFDADEGLPILEAKIERILGL